jgi:hypothetical protein
MDSRVKLTVLQIKKKKKKITLLIYEYLMLV